MPKFRVMIHRRSVVWDHGSMEVEAPTATEAAAIVSRKAEDGEMTFDVAQSEPDGQDEYDVYDVTDGTWEDKQPVETGFCGDVMEETQA